MPLHLAAWKRTLTSHQRTVSASKAHLTDAHGMLRVVAFAGEAGKFTSFTFSFASTLDVTRPVQSARFSLTSDQSIEMLAKHSIITQTPPVATARRGAHERRSLDLNLPSAPASRLLDHADSRTSHPTPVASTEPGFLRPNKHESTSLSSLQHKIRMDKSQDRRRSDEW